MKQSFYCGFVAVTLSAWVTAKPIEVLYTANRQGSIEPCGCTTNQIGGIDRMASWVGKKGGAILLDSGDTFFSAPMLNPLAQPMERARATLIAKSYREVGVRAMTLGERDFALGIEELNTLQKLGGFKFVSVNLRATDARLEIEPYLLLSEGGNKVAVVGVSDPDLFPPEVGVTVTPAIPALETVWEKVLAEKPDVTVLLSHVGLSKDREIAKKLKPNIILGAHSMDALEKPIYEGETAIFQVSHEGQAVGSFEWEGGKVKASQWVPLDVEFQKPNKVRKWMDEYYRDQKKREASAPVPAAGNADAPQAFVANPLLCKQCHYEQYHFWEKTKHASAMLVLYAKGRHLDPDCIGCHTLGFGQPEGFSRAGASLLSKQKVKSGPLVDKLLAQTFSGDTKASLDSKVDKSRYERLKENYHQQLAKITKSEKVVKNYLGVQCEHCHGNRSGHLKNPSVRRTGGVESPATCLKCHVEERSPGFKPEWKSRIACPLRNGKKS